ncbi:kelch repeat-containing protein [Nocardiopsis sp. FIRDI 009]|uniref:Kelch repeat-containing protein n=1 Tax=Nocardiopsis sp. FIRDI 009 TaxID=714197 RepID=UPI000E284FCB|nr:kelch repeat-containing protein [Nocardiopsis sp. FIRDI 009]
MRRGLGAVVPALALLPVVASCAIAGAEPWEVGVTVDELPPAPFAPREDHGLVWSGEELLVWGGHAAGQHDSFADGAAYSPRTGAWRTLADVDLEPRTRHTTVMVGERMLVWGGFTPTYADDEDAHLARDGALYDPEADSWEPVADAPQARSQARGVVVGEHVVVGGGDRGRGTDRHDFLVYAPEEDAWDTVALPLDGEPGAAVYDLTAVGDTVVAVGSTGREIFTATFRVGDEAAAVRVVPEAGGTAAETGLAAGPGGTALLVLCDGETVTRYEIGADGRAEPVDEADHSAFRPAVSVRTALLLSGDMAAVDGTTLLATAPGEFSLWDTAGGRTHREWVRETSDYCGPLVPVAEDTLLGWGGRGCETVGVSVGVDV